MMEKLFVIAALLISFAGTSQTLYCTNNYKIHYDSAYSKHPVKIDLDAIGYLGWVATQYKYFGVNKRGETIWKENRTGLLFLDWKLWLLWNKEDKDCIFE